jgi:6-phosphogluconate dehydrogenase
MDIAMIGLGKMGNNMSVRLLNDKHRVVVFDLNKDVVKELAGKGAVAADDLADVVKKLNGPGPKVIWLMLPGQGPIEKSLEVLVPLLAKGDVIIDGGNSKFTMAQERSKRLAEKGIGYLDAGTSGGLWGLKFGYCLMVGGDKESFAKAEPIIKTLAPPNGYHHCGASGSGHFTKMVHNGIEYGMMQAYAEGFELLSKSGFDLDLAKIADLWGQGSVVRSWLLELLTDALKADPKLEHVKGYVEDTGEGRWTVEQAIEKAVPMPVITEALFARFRSRQNEDTAFGSKINAALRNQFGGHAIKK